MTAAASLKIEQGLFALSLVDTAAVGYDDAWQTPGGVDVENATLADYTDAVAQWSCQVQTMTIDPTAQNNDETVEATWCEPSTTIPNPGVTTFAINGTAVADAHATDSLQAFLYLNDTREAYFIMGLNGEGVPPVAAGRCRIIASSFGGAGRTTLTMSINGLPVTRRYDLWHGTAPGSVIEGLTNTERPAVPTLMAAAAAPASAAAPAPPSSSTTSSTGDDA